MQKFMLKSGKKVTVGVAPIEVGLNLYFTVVNACKGVGLDLTVLEADTLADVFAKNIDAILAVIGSKDVLEAIKDCCSSVTYDNQKFSMDIFEKEKNRGDFFPLMQLVGIENLRPFFPSLHIVFNPLTATVLAN